MADDDDPPSTGRLYRSRSLPQEVLKKLIKQDSIISAHSSSQAKDSGIGSEQPSGIASEPQSDVLLQGQDGEGSSPQSQANKNNQEIRTLLTLKQHYYPEGGWGWVIVTCAVLVQILTHGLQVSFGILLQEIVRRFGSDLEEPAGK